jgi:hypothetical protein
MGFDHGTTAGWIKLTIGSDWTGSVYGRTSVFVPLPNGMSTRKDEPDVRSVQSPAWSLEWWSGILAPLGVQAIHMG